MRVLRTILFSGLMSVPAFSHPLRAQQADVIRGRITGDDGKAIERAAIVATSIPGNVAKNATTDNSGRYAITFPSGDGDYWIAVTAIGFTPKRFQLKRMADEQVLIGDAKLERNVARMDSVRVQGRTRPGRNDNTTDIGGTDRIVGSNAVDPTQAGNLAAIAASMPGVQLIPGANGNPDQFSVFGLGGDQNTNTLNGLSFGGGEVPRDAAMRSSLGTTPWDVSRGGFSGGQFAMRTQSGTNFSSRGLSSFANTPALEWTDRAGRSAGAEYTSMSLGASTAGPIVMDKSFYSIGYQLDRRLSDVQSLTTADALALQTAGVVRDSVDRFRDVLSTAGVPLTTAGLPTSRMNDRGLLLGTFDFSPPSSTSGQSFNVTVTGTFNRQSSPFGAVTALPTRDAETTNWFGAVQGRHTNYLGFGALTETSVGVTGVRSYTDPYLALPSGSVRVRSTLADGSTAISQLGFGGNPTQNTTNTSTSIGGQNHLSWFTGDNKHRLKLSTELRYDRYNQDLSASQLGAFSYNSLADLEAGAPASFMRLLSSRITGGDQIVGALAIGDSYRPRTDLQFQFGVRIDANRFLTSPARNATLNDALGVDNEVLPSRVYVSPRAGFSWTYGEAAQLAIGNGFARGPRAVVRGGLGLFQNTPNTQIIGGAIANTGLANAVQQVACVGTAVPAPDWNAYRNGPDAIPTQCADGTSGTAFASGVPNAVYFARSYEAQRSARANLNWSGAVLGNRFASTVDATYSLNVNQPGMADRNFNPLVRFSLATEGGRPVYVQPSSIVPASGAIVAQDARLSADFARVIEQRSDLRSASRQFTVGLRPLSPSTRYNWSVSYVYSNTRDIAAGLGSTAGDPRLNEWGRSPMDSRHQVVYGVSYNLLDWFPISLQGSFRSGRPYTPLVAGDINGDGSMNDRAFVFDPRTATDPGAAAGIDALLAGGSSSARACLSRQLGGVARRNSCQGPWTSTSSLTIGINPLKLRLPQRLNLAVSVNNALGAADLLLRGENKRRGWGQSVVPDQPLLFVRGFDAAAQAFKYDVNPRFGATNLNQTLNRNPVVVTLQARIDVGFTRERQLLTQSLDRGRVRPGAKPTDQTIRGMGTTLIPTNPLSLIIAQADSLKLTRKQADSLATLNRAYAQTLDSIWAPVAKELANLPPVYDRAVAYQRYRMAREASVDNLIAIAPTIRGILTTAQMRLLPARVASSLDVQYLAFVRSSSAGDANLGMLGMLAQMGWMGVAFDASNAGQSIMVHQ